MGWSSKYAQYSPRVSKNKARLAAIFLATTLATGCGPKPEQEYNDYSYTEFVRDAKNGEISEVTIQGNVLTGRKGETGEAFQIVIPENENVVDRLQGTEVEINTKEVEKPGFGAMFGNMLPLLLILGAFYYFIFRRMGGGPGGPGGPAGKMNKQQAEQIADDSNNLPTFDDVAGAEDAKKSLHEVVEFLKNPTRLQRLGGKVPTGTLLEGPPGTGKTLLARAIAGEAGVPFFSISGSEFIEMYVGVGAKRVRDIFARAKKNSPCILFIDEIDAVAKKRSGGSNSQGGHDEQGQTVNQILTEMDGFDVDDGVVVLAATNRMGDLDPALLRPGRFDRKIIVPLPHLEARRDILKVHTRKSPVGPDVDFEKVAENTAGFSGADLANLVNEAAILAAKRGKHLVEMEDFEDSRDHIAKRTAEGTWSDFGKSKAQYTGKDQDKTTFADVAGVDSAKEDLQDVINFLKNPEQLQSLGGKVPTGTLLEGPPGTGKTLLAKAAAGEAGVPFYSAAGSDFVEKLVGEGASRVRDLFAEAKKHAPCILFIDEIDAVGKARGGMNSHDEREQTLNAILVEMDGFDKGDSVVVIGATNRSDVLDKALLRPGRFDRKIIVPLPDLVSREAILKVHTKQTPLGPDVSLHRVAQGSTGYSGADLANLVNEAAVLASKNNQKHITMDDFEEAGDKIRMGAPRDSLIMDDDEKQNTAWHEAGHALVSIHAKHSKDPIYKATVMARGQALGMVMRIPEKDTVSYTLGQLKAEMAIAHGGRTAELIRSGGDEEAVTTGASNDIEQATNIATKMVKEWGFSKKLGPVRHVDDQQGGYLGGGAGSKEFSEETAQIIDQEIRDFIIEAESTAKNILETHSDQLELLANALIEYETLTGDEILKVIEGKPLDREAKKKDTKANKPSNDKGQPPITPK